MSGNNNDKIKMLCGTTLLGIKDLTSKEGIEFNMLAGRLYKYPFFNQVLIYAQNPKATAVASEHVWKDIMHRDLKENATAIAAYSNGKTVYLFDEKDTEMKEDSLDIGLWTKEDVPETWLGGLSPLEKGLSIAKGESFKEITDKATQDAINDIINTLGADNTPEYQTRVNTTIRAMVALQVGSRIGNMDYDAAKELNTQIAVQNQGVKYADSWTVREMAFIGVKASQASQTILKDLYKEIERQMEAENENGDNIREEGRDTLSESTDRGTQDDNVYEREGDIPETGADGRLHTPDNGGDIEPGTPGSGETVPGGDAVGDVRTDGDSEHLQTEKTSDSLAEIKDFGAKIGGARKDLYGAMIQYEDIHNMTGQEQIKLAKKDKIWPKTDWEKVIREGADRTLCWWKNEMRKSASPGPYLNDSMDADEKLEVIDKYVRNMTAIRDAVMACETRADVESFNQRVFGPIIPITDYGYHSSPTRYSKRGIRGNFLDEDYTVSYELYDMSNFTGTSLLSYRRHSWSEFTERAKKELFGISKDAQLYESIMERSKIFRVATKEEVENPHSPNMGPVGYFEILTSERKAPTPVLKIKDGGSSNYIYPEYNRVIKKDHPELLTEEGWHVGDYCAITEAALLSPKESYFSYSSDKVMLFPCADRRDAELSLVAYAQTMQEAYNRKVDEDRAKAKELKAENQKADPIKYHTAPLTNIKRVGEDYRKGQNATTDMYEEIFKFGAGEFGNWNSQKERQECLNAGFDAFKDLAKVLGVTDDTIALKTEGVEPVVNGFHNPEHSLAIAFGARGRGGKNAGLAHYEPARNVINITKKRGAGSTAHEYGHALDEYIGKCIGNVNPDLSHSFTEVQRTENLPEALQDVLTAMLTRRKNKEETIEEEKAFIKDTILDDMARLRPNPMTAAERDNFSTRRAEACARNIKNDPDKLKAWDEAVDRLLENEEKADPFCFRNYRIGNREKAYSGGAFEPLLELKETFLTLGGEENPRDFDKEFSDSALHTDIPLNDIAKKYNSLKCAEKNTREFITTQSDYCTQAKKIDEQLCPSKPYWSTPTEMFARAFSLYIKEKMDAMGMTDTYLTKDLGLDADVTIPHGKEKEDIFKSFDNLIEYCKEQGYLQAASKENELSKEIEIDDEEEEER